jgi:hypothetical protein
MLVLGRKYVTATGRQFRAFHFVINKGTPELFVHLLEDVEGKCLPVDHFRPVSEVNKLIEQGTFIPVSAG